MRIHPWLRRAALVSAAASLALVARRSIVSAADAPKPFSSFDAQVKPLLAQMTLDEKIGQMTQPDQSFVKNPEDVETLALGSLLSGGSSDPKAGNSLEAWTDMYDGWQARTAKSRLKIPLLYGVDAVHGHNNVLGAVIFPHNVGLGCTRDAALVEKIERITAEEVRASGIQWAFAPCVTVPQDIRWGRSYEGFGEDPALVKELGEAATRGLQGMDLANPLAVLACAKHFIGDGGTAYGTGQRGRGLDQGDTRVDEATLRRVHLQGYISAVKAGVGSIMPSYNSWNGVKVSGIKYLLTDMLKKELGFEGFLISDYNAIDQLDKDYKKAIGISINAGMDMAMVPSRYKEYIADLKQLVAEGVVPMSRIDDAVTRILRVKFAMGMLDPKRSQLADRGLWKTFGSPEHRAVARQAVRESLVLLQNDEKLLPLSKTAKRIHVVGAGADDIGRQSGGWTIDWQGKSGPVTTGGTTILAAIKAAVAKGAQVTYSRDGSGAEGATVAVAVIGEPPYAEGAGDRADLGISPEDMAAVSAAAGEGVPVVAVLLSGRPLILGDLTEKASAIVAAWLPGTEGAGVADVLFGDHKPSGKLSFTWPKTMAAVGKHKGDAGYDPQFPFGFGLSY